MSSRRNKGGGGHDGGEERWLLPYADMITLLLGLFIVLFAMSTIDAKQFDNVRRSLSQTFNGQVLSEPGGVLSGADGVLDPSAAAAPNSIMVVEFERAAAASQAKFDEQARELRKLTKQAGLGNDVEVTRNEVGIKVSLAGDALFDTGRSDLKPGIVDKLVRIERELAQFDHPILITGHTDKVGSAASNRALGYARASAVYSLFMDKDFADTRVRLESGGEAYPVDPSTADGVANAKNRRIEITILAPAASSPLPKEVGVARAAASVAPKAPVDAPRAPRPVDAEVERQISNGLVSELAETSKAGG